MKRRKRAESETDSDCHDERAADGSSEDGGHPTDTGAHGRRKGRRMTPPTTSLVVNGKAAARGQFPYQAGLIVTKEQGVNVCGAVLLSDRWLLTAAHCCREGTSVRVFLGSYPTMVNSKQSMDSSLVVMHPMYKRENPGICDLALIRLPKPVRFSTLVKPVRLPTLKHKRDDFAGCIATLSGWGKTSDEDDRPRHGTAVLRYAHERVLANEEAETILERKLPPHVLCARGLQGEVSCNGDSGGPLVINGPDGSAILIGVVSHRYAKFCSTSKAHVCTRITSFLPWIASVSRVPIE